jgi:hypothetical protein
LALASLVASSSLATPARAVTTLTADLSTPIGQVTHAASGSLYGVIETVPADVTALIAPLHPKMFNNPATDVQQPVGDAIVVAGRVAPIGATVTIRLADWFTGFYTFTNMTDWFNKIGQTVSRKTSAGLTNIYAYEIWNEPNGTWSSSNPLSFNEFWRQTYAQLRQLDPTVKITGPSTNFFDQNYISNFLSFCKTNNCLPDIVGWHELGGATISNDVEAYRALEKQLGIGPLPISINEYSGSGRITDEGRPGASAPLIAEFERSRVDTACISFWDVGHPGRLGSLLATNMDRNGGWWLYKWYGDMSGNMVTTSPAANSGGLALDGFANLDGSTGTASVVFGGNNDGTIQIVVKGFTGAPSLSSKVHAVVEHTPWVDRATIVNATDTLSTVDLTVTNDQITVSVANANNNDGYRLMLTSLGGSFDGGSSSGSSLSGSGSSGSSSSGGSSSATRDGGGAGTGMLSGTSGSAGSSGGTGTSSSSSTSGNSRGDSGASSGSGGLGVTGAGVASSAPGSSSGCGCMAVSRGSNWSAWAGWLAYASIVVARRHRQSAADVGPARERSPTARRHI